MRIVMFTTRSRTFRWDWVEAARGCAELIVLERCVGELPWPSVPGLAFLAQNPEKPLEYQLQSARKLPHRYIGPLADAMMVRRVSRVVRYLQDTHGPIDVLHTHFYAAARYLPSVKRKTGIPYVITEHSTALTLESPDKAIDATGLKIAARAYRHASLVMPVSHSLERAIRSHRLPGDFRVVSNPIDISMFQPARRRPPQDTLQIVSVARLALVKGYDVLLHALRFLVDEIPNIQVRVVGKGPCHADLLDLRDQLGLSDTVDFVGHKSRAEIAEILRSAHMFVLPSRTENLPVALIEAMASGLPIVATEVGGVPEMVSSDAGLLVPPENAEALASAMGDVLRRLDEFDPLQLADVAHQRYSFDKASGVLAEVYRCAAACA